MKIEFKLEMRHPVLVVGGLGILTIAAVKYIKVKNAIKKRIENE